jgi:hypothetical protein
MSGNKRLTVTSRDLIEWIYYLTSAVTPTTSEIFLSRSILPIARSQYFTTGKAAYTKLEKSQSFGANG